MKAGHYRLLDHTADFGLEIRGEDAISLFANAAAALFDVMISGRTQQARHRTRIDLQGQDWADLMVNWLRELLYLWNGEARLLHSVQILSLSETDLHADLFTDDYSPEHHQINHEIKAVTYHRIEVGSEQQEWYARVIFDV